MDRSRVLRNSLPPVLLSFSLFVIYLQTLAPGLTWANGGSDGGDLITAAATGGVAHPTGYPFYLILARLFQFLPVGSLALRTNLMSALFTALAAGLLYSIVVRFSVVSSPVPQWLAGLAAGYAFGFAPLIWSQASITEVYALHAFLVLWILYLYTKPVRSSDPQARSLDGWRGLVLGLSLGNQITSILLAPIALLLGSMRGRPDLDNPPYAEHPWWHALMLDTASLGRQLKWFGLGVLLYLLIPLRALSHPPINWGNAVTPGRLWWLVSGQLYQSYYLQITWSGLGERLRDSASLLLEQFGLPGLVLGVTGLVMFWSSSRLHALSLWTAVATLAFAVFYRPVDWQVYLIPLFLSFALWIGLGTAGLARALSTKCPVLGWSLGLLFIAYCIARGVMHVGEVDASGDLRAEAFGREVLAAAPPHAMIFAEGDEAIFALWYFHFALGQRPDLAVMASDLLHFDWYQETLRSTYPSLVIPGPFPWPETMAFANPARPSCQVRYTDGTEIRCAEPLTPH